MAANKDKTRAAAQKYLQKGQLDKAIREYQRLVEDDPKDVRTLLKIGDLQTRSGDHVKATETYSQVAQFYSDQGFFLKAVAVYKQILRLDSSLVEVNLKLADLYFQLGLMSDAANQYQQVSQIFEREGRIEESIDILKKMVELDPDNVASRIKLAESFAQQGRNDEARSHFQTAADYLKRHHRIDDYIKVAERVIHFDPNDLATTRELANIYIQKNDPRRALTKLQVCFKDNPKDVETLNLLATAFKGLGQTAKTVSVYRELGRIHAANSDIEAQRSAMRKILAIDANDAEAQQVLESTETLPDNALGRIRPTQKTIARQEIREVNRPPASPPPLPPPPPVEDEIGIEVEVEAPSSDMASSPPSPPPAPPAADSEPMGVEESINRILIEADVYIKYGLKTKAIEHIRKVFALQENHREARLRYKDLLVDTGELDAAVAELMLLAASAADEGTPEQALSDLRELLRIEPNHAQAQELLERLSAEVGDLIVDADSDFIVADDRSADAVSVEPSLDYDPSPIAATIDLDDEDDEGLGNEAVIDAQDVVEFESIDDAGIDLETLDELTDFDDLDEVEDDTGFAVSSGESEVHFGAAPRERTVSAPVEEKTESGETVVDFSLSNGKPPSPPSTASNTIELENEDGGNTHAPFDEESTPAGLDDLDALLASAVPSRRKEPVESAPRSEPRDDRTDAVGAAHVEFNTPTPEPTIASGESIAFVDAESDAELELRSETAPLVESEGETKLEVTTQPEGEPDDDDVDLSDEVEEIRFFLEQGLEDEAREQLNALIAIYGERSELTSLAAELEPEADLEEATATDETSDEKGTDPSATQPPAVSIEDEDFASVDFTTELGSELDDLASSDDYQVAFQDVFDEFKRGVAEVVEEGDSQTHYDLGIAYKEMGLFVDAMREFEQAANSGDKAIGALTMLGLCSLALGDSAQALTHFLRGINSPDVTAQEALALRFEIGQAYESMGRFREAIKFYEKVESINSEFRGVVHRLAAARDSASEEYVDETINGELDQLLTETDAERAARDKGDKISYI